MGTSTGVDPNPILASTNYGVVWKGSAGTPSLLRPTNIGSLTNFSNTFFYDINDSSFVVAEEEDFLSGIGTGPPFSGPQHTFSGVIFDSQGGSSFLVPPSASGYSAILPRAINNLSQIVGLGVGGSLPTIILQGSSVSPINLPATETGFLKINNIGDIVSLALSTADSLPHLFLYKAGQVMDLGTFPLPQGQVFDARSLSILAGVGINDRDVAVATLTLVDPSGGPRPFIYDASHGLRNLNDLLPKNSGWELQEVRAINNHNEITGIGALKGTRQAFLMRVNEITASLAVTGKYKGKILAAQKIKRGSNVSFELSLLNSDTSPVSRATVYLQGSRLQASRTGLPGWSRLAQATTKSNGKVTFHYRVSKSLFYRVVANRGKEQTTSNLLQVKVSGK